MTSLIPSATVILLRPAEKGLNIFEVLLLRRNAKLTTHGGSWVFPGGKFDRADYQGVVTGIEEDGSSPQLSADERILVGKRAAIRETWEEAGIVIEEDALLLLSTWLTPATMNKRFDAIFFIAQVSGAAEVNIDGSEISEYRWASPSLALSLQRSRTLTLPPSTFVTLTQLARFDCPSRAINELCEMPVHFRPKLVSIEGGACSLYEEDAAYPTEQLETIGPRHRLLMLNRQFRYESDY